MAYDPRQMMQIGQMGVGMMGPQQGSPFAQAQPKQWWEQWQQPTPAGRNSPYGGSDQQGQGGQPDQSADPSTKRPPSLYEMMMNLGRMTPADYYKAAQGPGNYGVPPKDAGRLGPMGFLGSMRLPGGTGPGGTRTPGY